MHYPFKSIFQLAERRLCISTCCFHLISCLFHVVFVPGPLLKKIDLKWIFTHGDSFSVSQWVPVLLKFNLLCSTEERNAFEQNCLKKNLFNLMNCMHDVQTSSLPLTSNFPLILLLWKTVVVYTPIIHLYAWCRTKNNLLKFKWSRPANFKSPTSNAKCSPKEYFDDHVYQYESC